MKFDIDICRSELIRLDELKTTFLNDINRINERKEALDKRISAISALLECYAGDGHTNHLHSIPVHDDFIELRASTPERDRFMRTSYPSGMPNIEIIKHLNKMPGKKFISPREISGYAGRLKLKRPDWYIEKMRLSIMENKEKAKKIKPVQPYRPIEQRLRTPERDAILMIEWPAGTERSIIVEKLNALPGMKLNNEKVSSYASRIGLQRPEWYLQQKRSQSGLIAAEKRENLRKK